MFKKFIAFLLHFYCILAKKTLRLQNKRKIKKCTKNADKTKIKKALW